MLGKTEKAGQRPALITDLTGTQGENPRKTEYERITKHFSIENIHCVDGPDLTIASGWMAVDGAVSLLFDISKEPGGKLSAVFPALEAGTVSSRGAEIGPEAATFVLDAYKRFQKGEAISESMSAKLIDDDGEININAVQKLLDKQNEERERRLGIR